LKATFLPDAVGIWIAGAAWYASATEITPHNASITMWDIVFGGNRCPDVMTVTKCFDEGKVQVSFCCMLQLICLFAETYDLVRPMLRQPTPTV
jgi:hypothetical protein